jgi:hypothetical protein
MSPYRPPDYLEKARELRARRLGASLAPVRSARPSGDSEGRSTESSSATIKATRKHALITTPDQVAELATSLEAATRVALDLETTGLDPRRARIRLLSLAMEGGVWLVDCFKVDPRPLFPILASKTLVIHNASFDLGFLAQMGFELGEGGRVIDSMLLSLLVEGLRPKGKDDG